MANCELCGEPMPAGEEMFKYHGYSGRCPKPPKVLPLKMQDFREVMAEVTKAAMDCRQDLKAVFSTEPPKKPEVGELVVAASIVYLAEALRAREGTK